MCRECDKPVVSAGDVGPVLTEVDESEGTYDVDLSEATCPTVVKVMDSWDGIHDSDVIDRIVLRHVQSYDVTIVQVAR